MLHRIKIDSTETNLFPVDQTNYLISFQRTIIMHNRTKKKRRKCAQRQIERKSVDNAKK